MGVDDTKMKGNCYFMRAMWEAQIAFPQGVEYCRKLITFMNHP